VYDRHGDAIAYIERDRSIFSFGGDPLGYLVDEKIYSYGGQFLGWLENGWLHDRNNDPALFSENATGGPLRPLRSLASLKSLKSLKPLKSLREMPPLRPLRGSSWSEFSGLHYFE
jgi:hypothetical protein